MKWLAIVVALALVLFAGAIFVRGRPAQIGDVSADVEYLLATHHGVFTVSEPGSPDAGPARVWYTPLQGGETVPVLQARQIHAIAVAGGKLHAVVSSGEGTRAGQLVTKDLKTGAVEARDGLSSPQGLCADTSRICWTEARPAIAPDMPHVPIIGTIHVIKTADSTHGRDTVVGFTEASKGRFAAQSPDLSTGNQTEQATEASGGRFAGQLLGIHGDNVYWTEVRDRQLADGVTLVQTSSIAARSTQYTLLRQMGEQQGVLQWPYVYSTGWSEETDEPSAARIVRRVDLREDNRAGNTPQAHSSTSGSPAPPEAVTITDLLPGSGRIIADDASIYYAEWEWLWAVPESLRPSIPAVELEGAQAALTDVTGGNVYSVGMEESGYVLERRPVHWRGWVTAALPSSQLDTARLRIGTTGAGSR